MSIKFILRTADENDANAIIALQDDHEYIHRHLDWRTPVGLLGKKPYWVIEQNFSIKAALACPIDPPGIAWIRFFATQPDQNVSEAWERLFNAALHSFQSPPQMIASVAVQAWFTRLLISNQFYLHQTIVVLCLDASLPRSRQTHPDIQIERMQKEHLAKVTEVDHASFETLWRNSSEDLQNAFENAAYATIARKENEIIGYQISSATSSNAHLARLAVIPELQGSGYGSALTKDLINHFRSQGIGLITVNTQNNNTASLRLYKKLGFVLTGERFPVMKYSP